MMTAPIRVTTVSAHISGDRQSVLATLSADDGQSVALQLSAGALGELIATLTQLDRVLIDELDADLGGPEGP